MRHDQVGPATPFSRTRRVYVVLRDSGVILCVVSGVQRVGILHIDSNVLFLGVGRRKGNIRPRKLVATSKMGLISIFGVAMWDIRLGVNVRVPDVGVILPFVPIVCASRVEPCASPVDDAAGEFDADDANSQ